MLEGSVARRQCCWKAVLLVDSVAESRYVESGVVEGSLVSRQLSLCHCRQHCIKSDQANFVTSSSA